MSKINKKKPVLVTGATGYVAGWVVKKLLEQGTPVHAAVRNPGDHRKIAHLEEMSKQTKTKLTFFASDLESPGSYEEAMKGCEIVFHIASPFSVDTKDAINRIINPAINGTKNVLDSVNKTDSVKRVVLTSSVVAVIGDSIDAANKPNNQINEDDWNTSSTTTYQPYSYSKTMAERAAWKIAEQQERWDLAVINPGFVIGPATNPASNFESKSILTQIGDGTFKQGLPDIKMGTVDVRNVAEAHVLAGYNPEAKGRYITCAEACSFLELAQALLPKYNSYPIPRKAAPKWLLWLLAPFFGLPRKFISRNVGYPVQMDNSKSIRELGLKYIPLEKSVNEFFEQLIDQGVFKK